MISVLYTLVRLRPGGSFTLTRNRIEQVMELGIRPHVCALLPLIDQEVASRVAAEWRDAGVRVTTVGHRGRKDAGRTVATLTRLARDVDIVHNTNATQGYVAAAARLARKPLVRDLISTAAPTRTDRIVAKIATINLAVSHAVADTHAAPRTTVLYPPVDLSTVKARRPDIQQGNPTVLVVARFAPGKGSHLLPGIAAALKQRRPHVRMVLVGDGDGRADLEAGLLRAGADDVVTMLGYRADVAALHELADVYLSTSEAEGLVGYATLEAAVHGTPIVASNIPAVTEILRHNEDALIVDVKNASAAAQAVVTLAEDEELRSRLSQSAKERVLRVIDPQESGRRLVALYRTLA